MRIFEYPFTALSMILHHIKISKLCIFSYNIYKASNELSTPYLKGQQLQTFFFSYNHNNESKDTFGNSISKFEIGIEIEKSILILQN